MEIIYYASDEVIGTDEGTDCYRDWAKEVIKEEYPDAEVYVLDESSDVVCDILDAEESVDKEEIVLYIESLPDICDWEWAN